MKIAEFNKKEEDERLQQKIQENQNWINDVCR